MPNPTADPRPPIANRRRPYTDAEYRVLVPPAAPSPSETNEDSDDWL